MQITILTMPLVIAEYLPRPSALDARPAFGRAVADRNVNAHYRPLRSHGTAAAAPRDACGRWFVRKLRR